MIRLTLIVLALAAVGCASRPPSPVTVRWTKGPPLPQPLGGHAAAVLPEGIVVAGGSNWPSGVKTWRDEVYVLDETSSAWRQTAKLPAGMTLPAATVKDGKLLLLGGWLNGGTTGETFCYANSVVDRSVTQPLPQGRAQAGGATLRGVLYVIGGLTDGADFHTATTSVLRLDPRAPKPGWSQLTPHPKPLALSAVIAFNERIYVFGGMGPSDEGLVDSDRAYFYEPARDRWTRLPPIPGARRGSAIVAVDDRYLLLIGGCRNVKDVPVMLNDVLAYDTIDDRYYPCDPLPFAALCEQAVFKDGRVYVIGGEDLPKHRTDRVVIGNIIRKSPRRSAIP